MLRTISCDSYFEQVRKIANSRGSVRKTLNDFRCFIPEDVAEYDGSRAARKPLTNAVWTVDLDVDPRDRAVRFLEISEDPTKTGLNEILSECKEQSNWYAMRRQRTLLRRWERDMKKWKE